MVVWWGVKYVSKSEVHTHTRKEKVNDENDSVLMFHFFFTVCIVLYEDVRFKGIDDNIYKRRLFLLYIFLPFLLLIQKKRRRKKERRRRE